MGTAADAPVEQEVKPPLPRRHARQVVGGGYAGVEALAELQDLARDACASYPSRGAGSTARCSSHDNVTLE